MALAKLPKAFQLESNCKGWFPHMFTCKNNENYVGPYPPLEMYGPDHMSRDDRAKFMQWYGERVAGNDIFDFQKEILKYCQNDVDILRQACLKFKNLLLDVTGRDGGAVIQAFDSCTIASLCMDVFQQKHLTEEWKVKIFGEEEDQWLNAKKINGEFFIEVGGQWVKKEHAGVKILEEVFVKSPLARPPPNGYHSRINYSKKSIQWLKLLQHRVKKS